MSGGDKHRSEVLAILGALGFPETDAITQKWGGLTGRDNAYGLHARAHRNSLAAPRKVDDDFLRFWDDTQDMLDQVLECYESRYLETIKVLDELLAKTNPTAKDVVTLKNHVPNTPVCRGYFFNRVTNPEWFPLLLQAGFFQSPPEPIRDLVKQTVSFPQWPESQFLARAGKDDPKGVLDVALEIETDNPLVHGNLADAALLMPVEIAASLATREASWIEQQTNLYFGASQSLAKLVSQLAKGNQAEVALNLAAALLTVLPDTAHQSSAISTNPFRNHSNRGFGWTLGSTPRSSRNMCPICWR